MSVRLSMSINVIRQTFNGCKIDEILIVFIDKFMSLLEEIDSEEKKTTYFIHDELP